MAPAMLDFQYVPYQPRQLLIVLSLSPLRMLSPAHLPCACVCACTLGLSKLIGDFIGVSVEAMTITNRWQYRLKSILFEIAKHNQGLTTYYIKYNNNIKGNYEIKLLASCAKSRYAISEPDSRPIQRQSLITANHRHMCDGLFRGIVISLNT